MGRLRSLEKMTPKKAIFSTVLSKIVVGAKGEASVYILLIKATNFKLITTKKYSNLYLNPGIWSPSFAF